MEVAKKPKQNISTPQKTTRKIVFISSIALLLISLSVSDNEVLKAILRSFSDAYIQVTSFVAATLAIFYILESKYNFDTATFLQSNARWQVPIAALLGGLPGCGGAIIVVTQYTLKRLTFGSLIAALTTTMGDAAFLLISKEPLTSLKLILLQLFVGTLTGYIVDAFSQTRHAKKKEAEEETGNATVTQVSGRGSVKKNEFLLLNRIWIALIIPGLIMGVLSAFQIDLSNTFLGSWLPTFLACSGAMLCIIMWASRPFSLHNECDIDLFRKEITHTNQRTFLEAIKKSIPKIIENTNFVTTWVVFSYLLFEVPTSIFDLNLKVFFDGMGAFTPLLAVLIGFIPGCGPQIIATTLYLGGFIPFSAQIANAISNDGDALFPAIALAPKDALAATFYSAIPAIFCSYAYMFLFE